MGYKPTHPALQTAPGAKAPAQTNGAAEGEKDGGLAPLLLQPRPQLKRRGTFAYASTAAQPPSTRRRSTFDFLNPRIRTGPPGEALDKAVSGDGLSSCNKAVLRICPCVCLGSGPSYHFRQHSSKHSYSVMVHASVLPCEKQMLHTNTSDMGCCLQAAGAARLTFWAA